MGTRHLISVVVDKETKVAQYGQWDGYLSGQGQDVVDFIGKLDNLATLRQFKKNVRLCKFISDKKVQKKWEAHGADDSGFVDMAVAERFKNAHPELSRDTCAGILPLVLVEPRELHNQSSFATDGLFCEFAYAVDLDKKTLAVFSGGTDPIALLPFKGIKKAFKKLMKQQECEA